MNKKIFLVVISILLSLGLFSSTKAMTITEVQDQISALQAQIAQLQAQLAQMQTTPQTTTWCHNFSINLAYTDVGSEVEALQIALEKQGFTIDITEKTSKYFGTSTRSAVIGFQEKYASEILAPFQITTGTGYVGRTTRQKLDSLYQCTTTSYSPLVNTNAFCFDFLNRINAALGKSCGQTGYDPIADVTKDKIINSADAAAIEFNLTDEFTCRSYWSTTDPCSSQPVNIYPYPSFWMTTDKQNYSKGDIISLSIKRSDRGNYPYYVDLYINNLNIIKQKLDVSSPVGITTQIDTNFYEAFKSGLTGNYGIGVIASGETIPGNEAGKYNTNAIAVNYSIPSTTACTDSDGGRNYNTSGYVLDNGQKYTDYCIGNSLKEYFCLPTSSSGLGGVAEEIYNCPGFCSGGACLSTSSITILSPNGGEVWEEGKTYNITWNSSGNINGVKLSLTNEAGQLLYDNLVNVDGNPGVAQWTLPVNYISPGRYKVLIHGCSAWNCTIGDTVSTASSVANDISDNYFTFISSVPSCTRHNPTVTLTPTPQSGTPGSVKVYTINVTNNDTTGCASQNYGFGKVPPVCPSGWTCTLSKVALVGITPGATDSSATIMVTSNASAASGNYSISVTAWGIDNVQGTGTGVYTVPVVASAFCTEFLNRITAAFGKSCGQTGYDPVADVNKDKTINMVDTGTIASIINDEAACRARWSSTDPCPVAPCTRNSPTVTITNTPQSAIPGTLVNYIVNITNNDTATCAAAQLSQNAISCGGAGWTCALTQTFFTVAPGATVTTTYQVTSPATAAAGAYNNRVQFINNASGQISLFATATYNVVVTASGGRTNWTETCGAASKSGCTCSNITGWICAGTPSCVYTCPARPNATVVKSCTYSYTGSCMNSIGDCTRAADCYQGFSCSLTGGNCSYTCNSGWKDANNTMSDGCEATVTASTPNVGIMESITASIADAILKLSEMLKALGGY